MQSSGNLVVVPGFASRRGRREANEDYCGLALGSPTQCADHGIVAAVADGVGGAKGGRIAAELAVRSFIDGFYAGPPTLGPVICAERSILGFNRWLHGVGRTDPAMEGAAATFTALVFRGRRAHVFHVGDSRAWRFRDGRLMRLTEDHVLPQPDLRHVLYRALGIEHHVRLDSRVEELALHDRFLLTSDGVHGVLSDRAIERLLDRRGAPETDAEALVEAALAAGSVDNATALIVDVIELPAPNSEGIAAAAADLPVRPPPGTGAVIDGFRLEQLLSDGRYSRIFLAHDGAADRRLVLKFPKPAAVSEQAAKLAFLREQLVGTHVESPYVGEVVQLAPERQTCLYVALRFYEGETLEARLARGPMTLAAGLPIAAKIGRGIAALHRRGIVHRDIKPDNILVTPDGGVRIIDLGVARLPRIEDSAASETPGTPAYMAPELFDGAVGSEATDQFAFGVTLYRMFTGRYPYGEIEAFSRPRFGRPLQPDRIRPELPAWLGAAMLRSVALDPADRFADLQELVGVIEGGSARAVPVRRSRPLYDRNPLLVWKLVSLAFALALFAALLAH